MPVVVGFGTGVGAVAPSFSQLPVMLLRVYPASHVGVGVGVGVVEGVGLVVGVVGWGAGVVMGAGGGEVNTGVVFPALTHSDPALFNVLPGGHENVTGAPWQ